MEEGPFILGCRIIGHCRVGPTRYLVDNYGAVYSSMNGTAASLQIPGHTEPLSSQCIEDIRTMYQNGCPIIGPLISVYKRLESTEKLLNDSLLAINYSAS